MAWKKLHILPYFLLHISIPLDHILVLGVGQMLTGKRLLQLIHYNVCIVNPHLGGQCFVTLLLAGSIKWVDLLLQRRQLRIDVSVTHVCLPRTLGPSAGWTGNWFSAAVLAEILVVVGITLGYGFRWVISYGELLGIDYYLWQVLVYKRCFRTYPKVSFHINDLGKSYITSVFDQTANGAIVSRVLIGVIAFLRVLAEGAQIRVSFFFIRKQD